MADFDDVEPVRVKRVEGMRLIVEPAQPGEARGGSS